jgi:hypothetical protein
MSTVSAGGTLTAALWNSQVRDAENFFLAVPHVVLTQSVAQTVATATFAAITWDVEVRDNDSMHSTVTNTSRMTCVTAGWYEVSGAVGWTGSAVGNRLSRWAVNGTAVTGTEVSAAGTLATGVAFAAMTTGLFLNVGDYVELFGWQSSGGNLNTNVTGASVSRASVRWTGQ